MKYFINVLLISSSTSLTECNFDVVNQVDKCIYFSSSNQTESKNKLRRLHVTKISI